MQDDPAGGFWGFYLASKGEGEECGTINTGKSIDSLAL